MIISDTPRLPTPRALVAPTPTPPTPTPAPTPTPPVQNEETVARRSPVATPRPRTTPTPPVDNSYASVHAAAPIRTPNWAQMQRMSTDLAGTPGTTPLIDPQHMPGYKGPTSMELGQQALNAYKQDIQTWPDQSMGPQQQMPESPQGTPSIASIVPPAGSSMDGTQTPGAELSSTPPLSPNLTAAVDPATAKSNVYNYATLAIRQGIKLTPEQEQDFVNSLTVATGLDQPLQLVDPSTNQLVPSAYLEVGKGEIANDPAGMGRGARPNVIAAVIGQNAYAEGDLVNAVGYATGGSIGLTIDEIKFLYPNPDAKSRSMGYNWENDASVMAPDGSQGFTQRAPDGRTSAPIFSGFYLAPNGLYYPINTASLAPQQPMYRGGGGGGGAPTRSKPKPLIPGQNTPNSDGGGLGNLDQNLF